MTIQPEARCAGCGKPIVWAYTPAGKRMPLDPGAVEPALGTYVMEGAHRCRPSQPMFDPPGTRHLMNHFATCPDAQLFKGSPSGNRRTS